VWLVTQVQTRQNIVSQDFQLVIYNSIVLTLFHGTTISIMEIPPFLVLVLGRSSVEQDVRLKILRKRHCNISIFQKGGVKSKQIVRNQGLNCIIYMSGFSLTLYTAIKVLASTGTW
jgi:hypothetical protein